MVSADPLEEPSLPFEMLDPSCFWHRTDAGLADNWPNGPEPPLFPLPGDHLRLADPVLLHVMRRARLWVHCEALW